MSEYIELSGLGSSSEESLFDIRQGIRRRGDYHSIDINSSNSSIGSDSKNRGRNPIPGRIGSGIWGAAPQLETAAGQAGLGIAQSIFPDQVPKQQRGYIWGPGKPITGNDVVPSGYWNQYETEYNRLKEIYKAHKSVNSGLVLPFSNNIGPGNSIQPARTSSDLVAQGHDLHYQYATKDKDVLSADKEAVSQFAYEAINSNNPISQFQGVLGAVGLGIKTAIEHQVGVKYGKLCRKH